MNAAQFDRRKKWLKRINRALLVPWTLVAGWLILTGIDIYPFLIENRWNRLGIRPLPAVIFIWTGLLSWAWWLFVMPKFLTWAFGLRSNEALARNSLIVCREPMNVAQFDRRVEWFPRIWKACMMLWIIPTGVLTFAAIDIYFNFLAKYGWGGRPLAIAIAIWIGFFHWICWIYLSIPVLNRALGLHCTRCKGWRVRVERSTGKCKRCGGAIFRP